MKQVKDGAQGCRTKIISNAFAIPILTAISNQPLKPDAVKIGMANVLELIFILHIINVELHL